MSAKQLAKNPKIRRAAKACGMSAEELLREMDIVFSGGKVCAHPLPSAAK